MDKGHAFKIVVALTEENVEVLRETRPELLDIDKFTTWVNGMVGSVIEEFAHEMKMEK